MAAPATTTTTSTKAAHPAWHGPHGDSDIRVHNSLTSTIVPFVPARDKFIGWYTCGPTVYDSAHLGHARCYVYVGTPNKRPRTNTRAPCRPPADRLPSPPVCCFAFSSTFDIIRRILSDYFKYNVFYVMNITDLDGRPTRRHKGTTRVDRSWLTGRSLARSCWLSLLADKIIIRSRRNHLLKVYSGEAKDPSKVASDVTAAFAASLAAQVEKVAAAEKTWKESEAKKERYAEDNKQAYEEELAKQTLIANEQKAYEEELKKQTASGAPADVQIKALIAGGKGALAEYLDAAHGAEVTDHSIFKAHASYYEKEFLEDMRALGVRDSDALTRVTEYVQHIVDYVQGIVRNGFAYEANGSVYFDTAAFSSKGFSYAKLSPWSIGNTALTQSGEGALSGDSLGRKSGMDFALWKTSKKGEPAWDSPWGKGRPGWHIECSAMASDLLGVTFDVHSGGTDLKASTQAHPTCTLPPLDLIHCGTNVEQPRHGKATLAHRCSQRKRARTNARDVCVFVCRC